MIVIHIMKYPSTKKFETREWTFENPVSNTDL